MADGIKKPANYRRGRCLAKDGAAVQRQVDAWNAKHHTGTLVRYWSVLPTGPTKDTRTRSAAFVDSAGNPGVFVIGVSGYVSLHHVVPADELDAEAPPFSLET